jgi:NADPH:quinone reductase-like Zn-dependent oxidoreductase
MRVWQLENGFGLDHVQLAKRAEPEPGPGQVKVRVRAASLNYRDLLMIQGLYNPKQKLPLIPASDGAGEVVAIGKGVSRFKPGDRVVALFCQSWLAGDNDPLMHRNTLGGPLDGMLAEYVCLAEDGLLPIPEHLGFEEAATLPCAALTAWQALYVLDHVRPGQTVLTLGTGGVSLFALQLAVAGGAEVIITSKSDEKLERARALGAHHGINYHDEPQWGQVAQRLTDSRGVDHVVELGGVGTMAQSMQAVAPGGTISLIGVLSGPGGGALDVLNILMKRIRLQGLFVGSRAMFEAMNRALVLHDIHPVIGQVYDMAELPAALQAMASGQHFGKIVIRI